MALSQKQRFVELITPLGADRLLLTEATIHEALARPFNIDLAAVSPNPDIDFEALLGQPITLRLDVSERDRRYFHGHVFRISQLEPEEEFNRYHLTARPWFWFLTRTADCRIFQKKSIPDIAKEIFREHGYSDFEDRLMKTYEPREYCVQYRETDFDFISRLFEQEGIYYFFEHQSSKHTLILADDPSAHQPVPGTSTIPYDLPKGSAFHEQYISHWGMSKILQPGVVALNDFDFEKPSADLKVSASKIEPHQSSDLEIYDYPGEYTVTDQGDKYARTRIEELHSDYERMQGSGDVRALACGRQFTLKGHPRQDQNKQYLVIEANHQISAGDYRSAEGEGEHYRNAFTVIDAKTPFRPDRLTPRPMIRGPQTAIVVGPSGEEIYTDEYGRVKVQYHWDRYGKRDENSSCWVRVAQIWAGKNWGGIHIPRIGQEVIIEFLEGDPDQPIITGRVYNKEQMPPYELPANKTQSGIKSRSSKEGTPANFNEIRFEDKKGEEEVYIHAEKNQTNIVENDEVTDVGHNRTESVGNDETITIGHDRTEQVGNNENIAIGVNRTEQVGANETITIGSNRSVTIVSNKTETIAINKAETIGAAKELTIGGAYQVSVGGIMNETVAGAKTQEVGAAKATIVAGDVTENYNSGHSTSVSDDQTLQIGKDKNVNIGKNLTIDAGDKIVIQTGKSKIIMSKNGTITIQGKSITIKASGGNVVIKGNKVLEN